MTRLIQVEDFIENEDGSATIVVNLDHDTLLVFARKGLLAALVEAANETLENNGVEQ